MRSGSAYVAALRDGRAVYLDGERVKDVTIHPAFAEPIKSIAQTYDRARAAATGRQLQYEMFYSAAQPVVNTRMFKGYDWAAAKAAVDRCLGEY